jgi:prepilin-type N-terminal cleavage/methylation domain-containing protein
MHYVKKNLSHSSHTRGFTLIEVVAVLAIIGSLIMAVIPSIEMAMKRSSDTQLKTNLTMITGAAKIYKLDTGKYPDSIEILVKDGYLPNKEYKEIEFDAKNGIAKGEASNGTHFTSGTKDSK